MGAGNAAADDLIFLGLPGRPLSEGAVSDAASLVSGVLGRDVGDAKKHKADYDRRMDALRREAQKHGLDFKKVEAHARQSAERAYRKTGSAALMEDVGSGKAEALSRAVAESFWDSFRKMYDEVDSDNLSAAAVALMIVLFVNTFAYSLLLLIFGYTAAGYLVASFVVSTVVAPVVEEAARREMLVQHGKGGLGSFTIAINTYEFVYYVVSYASMGGALAAIIPLRLLVALLHHVLSAVQRNDMMKDLAAGKVGYDAGREGYRAAVILHGLWNGSMMLLQVLSASAGK